MFPAILSMTLRLTLAGAVAACAASPVFAQAADSGGGSAARSSARFSDAVELMRSDSSGNSVRVKVQNDDVVLVEVNGEAVPLDRARL